MQPVPGTGTTRSARATAPLLNLPAELLLHVLSYASVVEYACLRAGCVRARALFRACIPARHAILARFDTERRELILVAHAQLDLPQRRVEWAYFTFTGRYNPRDNLFSHYIRYTAIMYEQYRTSTFADRERARVAGSGPGSVAALTLKTLARERGDSVLQLRAEAEFHMFPDSAPGCPWLKRMREHNIDRLSATKRARVQARSEAARVSCERSFVTRFSTLDREIGATHEE